MKSLGQIMEGMMGKRKEKPDVPDYRESKGKKQNVTVQRVDNSLSCDLCGMMFPSKEVLSQHKLRHDVKPVPPSIQIDKKAQAWAKEFTGYEWRFDEAARIQENYFKDAFGEGGYVQIPHKEKQAKLDLAIEMLRSTHPQLRITVDKFQPGDYVSVRCESYILTEYRVSGSALAAWDVPELMKNLVKGLRIEEAYPEFPGDRGNEKIRRETTPAKTAAEDWAEQWLKGQ